MFGLHSLAQYNDLARLRKSGVLTPCPIYTTYSSPKAHHCVSVWALATHLLFDTRLCPMPCILFRCLGCLPCYCVPLFSDEKVRICGGDICPDCGTRFCSRRPLYLGIMCARMRIVERHQEPSEQSQRLASFAQISICHQMWLSTTSESSWPPFSIVGNVLVAPI